MKDRPAEESCDICRNSSCISVDRPEESFLLITQSNYSPGWKELFSKPVEKSCSPTDA